MILTRSWTKEDFKISAIEKYEMIERLTLISFDKASFMRTIATGCTKGTNIRALMIPQEISLCKNELGGRRN